MNKARNKHTNEDKGKPFDKDTEENGRNVLPLPVFDLKVLGPFKEKIKPCIP
jgi:hypothetical protein